MKKCLVTGATGFIGSNLVRKLVKEDYEVYALIRPNSVSGIERLKDIEKVKYITSAPKDILNEYKLPQLDVCFNLASYGVNYDNQDMYEMIDGNIKYLIEVIDFVSQNNTKLLIHTGSCFEYGITDENRKIDEDTPLNPQSLYGAAKASSTIMGNIYAKSKGVNMVTVRPFGIYGPGEGIHKLVPQLINAALNNKKIDMTYGEQIRDYLYIDDLVEAYIKISENNELKQNEIYNICSGNQIKIKEFSDIICQITGCIKDIFKLGKVPYRSNEVMYFVGDNKKIVNKIKWKPKVSLEEGISLMIYYMSKK